MATKYAQFITTKEEQPLIDQIVERAFNMAREARIQYPRQDIRMDVIACHSNGTPLDLAKLATAPDDTFGHDVFGIRRYINRTTGEIGQSFMPRCHARKGA